MLNASDDFLSIYLSLSDDGYRHEVLYIGTQKNAQEIPWALSLK